MRTLLLLLLLFTGLSCFSQDLDTLRVLTTENQYGHIETIRDRHGGSPHWYHEMNPNAPNGYYFIYKHYYDDSTKTYLLREGLFLNGYKEGEWIEYRTNGKKYCIEKWNKEGNTGYKKFFTERGKLQGYIRWINNEIVEEKIYRKCKNNRVQQGCSQCRHLWESQVQRFESCIFCLFL
jgi:hypothetical protein